MALTKVLRGGLSTGISDSSDATAITIDSSENVMINTSNTNPAESNVAGVSLMATNAISACDDGSAPIQLNRKSDNGSIAIFRKDGTGVGNIGVHDDDGFFFTRAASQQGIVLKNSSLMPCNTDGSNSDADQDLGISSVRWKDLYLSGGAFIGGTGSANKLDDYEEGTFTADLDASGATITQSVANGTYTKIGNQVNINIYVQCDGTLTTNSNAVSILGLPFTSVSTSQVIYYGCCGMRYVTMSSNYDNLMGYINNNDNKVQLFQHGKGQSPIALPSSGLSNSSGQIFLQMFYYTS